jgi:hypothetical protein
VEILKNDCSQRVTNGNAMASWLNFHFDILNETTTQRDDHCLPFFFWPLYCLSLFDLQLLLTPLTSSNFSCTNIVLCGNRLQGFVVRRLQLATEKKIKTQELGMEIILLLAWSSRVIRRRPSSRNIVDNGVEHHDRSV